MKSVMGRKCSIGEQEAEMVFQVEKQTILVVDDEEINVVILEKLLLSQGYVVLKAFNGFEALQKIGKNTPDLILLDIVMPEMDGYEVCRQLKADEARR